MKKCKACDEELPLEKYGKNTFTKDGHDGKCKSCRSAQRPTHSLECVGCRKPFQSKKKTTKYCGVKCLGESRKDRVTTNCAFCASQIEVTATIFGKQENHFCNSECFGKHHSLKMSGENNPNYCRAETTCLHCDKTFMEMPSEIIKRKFQFCSRECFVSGIGETRKGAMNSQYSRVECECNSCGVTFERIPSLVRGATYCSNVCRIKALTTMTIRIGEESRVPVDCLNCGKQVLKKPSIIAKVTHHYCSVPCKDAHHSTNYLSGEDNPNYNGALSSKYRVQHRLMPEYRAWRTAVYMRDSYACNCCGDNKGGNLIAHHLHSYATNPAIRVAVDNGVTLCNRCHKDFHRSYGYRNNTKDQYLQYKQYANHEPSRLGN